MWWGTERQTCLKFWKNWSDCSSCACETSHLETTLNHILFHRSSKRMILIRFTVPSAESGMFHLAKVRGEAKGVPQNIEVLKNSNFGENCSENNLWIQGDHVLPSTQLGETCFKGCLWVCPKIPTVFPLNWILLQQMLGRSLNTSTIHIVSILSKGQVEREPLRSRAPLSLVILGSWDLGVVDVAD